MSEAGMGMAVLVGISVLVAAGAHRWIRSFGRASLTAAVLSSVTFQCANFVHLGYLDPFFQLALVTGGAVALLVAVAVGLLMDRAGLRAQ